MTRQKLYFSIPDPCSQRWDAMSPKEGGRHCQACDKVIVNFSAMSDGELLRWFASRNGQNPCGIYRPDQLNREIVAPYKASWFQHWILAGGLLFSSLNTIARPLSKSEAVSYVVSSKQSIIIRVKVIVKEEGEIGPAENAMLALYSKDSVLLERARTNELGEASFLINPLQDSLRVEITDQRYSGSVTIISPELHPETVWPIYSSRKFMEMTEIKIRPGYKYHQDWEQTTAGINPHDNTFRHRRFCRHVIRYWVKWLLS